MICPYIVDVKIVQRNMPPMIVDHVPNDDRIEPATIYGDRGLEEYQIHTPMTCEKDNCGAWQDGVCRYKE